MADFLGNKVGRIGLGLMGFTWTETPKPTEEAVEVLKAAFEAGCTFWNGADFYGTPECNSMTLLKAYFTKYPEDADKITIVIKGGFDSQTWTISSSPEAVRKSLDNILNQLGGTKKLDFWSPSRRDPNTPLDVTMEIVQKEYIDTGKLGGFALSECRAETIHEAVKYGKVGLVEVELSMFSPDVLSNGVAAACAEHGIPIAAYSPIGRGMLTGKFKTTDDFKTKGMLSTFPRFQGAAFEHNLKLVQQVEKLAKAKGCTSAQLAINWVKSLSNRGGNGPIIPIPGSTALSRLQENSKDIELTEEDMKNLGRLVDEFEPEGGRYPDNHPTNT